MSQHVLNILFDTETLRDYLQSVVSALVVDRLSKALASAQAAGDKWPIMHV
jgi:hypothetical protein